MIWKAKFILWLIYFILAVSLRLEAQTYTYTNLYSFTGGNDGGNSHADLTISGNTLYGTTSLGGSNNVGTVFKINTDGTGFTVLKTFTRFNGDGEYPQAGLTLSGDTLYGTTSGGGSSGQGTVFKISTNGTSYTVLHSFTVSGYDGCRPYAELTLSGGTLYGTTTVGGSSGQGTVFKISTNGTSYAVLYSFTGSNGDGVNPYAGLTLSGGTLYGTTRYGGISGNGTLFKIDTNGINYTVLYSFTGINGDGMWPLSGLTLSGDTLYGTTSGGGSSGLGAGTAFKISTNGTSYAVLYSFTASNGDGAQPNAELTLSGDTLYGTTASGGSSGKGTVFKISTNGTSYTVLYSFTGSNGDGVNPYAGLTLSGGTLYGTTAGLGIWPSFGTVYSMVIHKATATVTLGNLSQIYDGTAKSATATTIPSGLTVIFTYNSSFSAPTNLGSYIVIGTINDANYQGSATNTLVIGTGLPQITIQPTNQTIVVTSNVAFSVSVSGGDPFTYQWQLISTNLSTIGIITIVAGNSTVGYSGDGGPATNAAMRPAHLTVDASGNLYISDSGNNRIRKVNTNGIITTVAGNGSQSFSGDNGSAINAALNNPKGVAVDAIGNLFIADYNNNRIRKVGTNGIIRSVMTNSSLYGVAVDAYGNLFITDDYNHVYKVSTNGTQTVVAGGGPSLGDGGAATNASFDWAEGVAVDAIGNLFIADYNNNRIRKVGTNGIITTVAGNGTRGYSGDGGAATNANITFPDDVAVDASGNIFIADNGNGRVRMVNTNGIITTVAGGGSIWNKFVNGGIATNCTLNPWGVTIDTTGNLFIAGNNNIYKVVWSNYMAVTANILTGQTNSVLLLTSVTSANAGHYFVVVTNSFGSVTSSIVDLIIAPQGYRQVSGKLLGASQMQLSFTGLAGTNYALDRSFTLSPANWVPVLTNPADVNGFLIFTNTPDSATNNFWRIRSVP